MKPDQERVRTIIHNTIISLCENGLKFDRQLRIEGVIGVTTDEQETFIIHVNESLSAEACAGNPFPGCRPSGAPSGRAIPPKSVPRRPSGQGAYVRARPPFQPSPNNQMGLRGFAPRGSPRINFASPRLQPGIQRSPLPAPQRMPVKSPGNILQGMPRLQRFSPKSSQPSPRGSAKPGLLCLPAPLAKEVVDDLVRMLPPKQLFPSGACRNSTSQFPQIGDVPCKREKMDVILVDDDDHSDVGGKSEETVVSNVESKMSSSPGCSLPDLTPEVFPTATASQAASGEMGMSNDTEVDVPVLHEPTVDDGNSSVDVPGCSGLAQDVDRGEQDEKLSTRASVDNSSIKSFDMGFAFDKTFNPEDYASEDYETEDMSYTDPSDEDWKTDEDSMSDPDWLDESTRKRKRRTTPKKTGTPKTGTPKTGTPGGSVFTPRQASNTPNQSRSKPTQKFGRFTEIPRSSLNSASGENDSWKLVARFVCNLSGCNASFSQKYNLIRHQRAKHGVGRATRRSSTLMPELDQGDSFG